MTTIENTQITKTIEAPEPGVYENIPFEQYLAWDAADCSLLKKIDHSAEYAHYHQTHPEPDKDAYAKGRLFHLLIGEPEKADAEFIIKPATYIAETGKDEGKEKKWNGNANVCKGWFASQKASGRTVVTADVMDECRLMAARVLAHPTLGPMIADAKVEVSVVWIDKMTGLKLKGRFDLFKAGIVVDAKSTSGKASPEAFAADAYRYKYHLQAAMYLDAVIALKLTDEVPWFTFAAVEGYAPHSICVFDVQDDIDALSYDFLHLGRIRYRALLQHYKWCVDHDEWPGYGEEHFDMELPYRGRKELEDLTTFSR